MSDYSDTAVGPLLSPASETVPAPAYAGSPVEISRAAAAAARLRLLEVRQRLDDAFQRTSSVPASTGSQSSNLLPSSGSTSTSRLGRATRVPHQAQTEQLRRLLDDSISLSASVEASSDDIVLRKSVSPLVYVKGAERFEESASARSRSVAPAVRRVKRSVHRAGKSARSQSVSVPRSVSPQAGARRPPRTGTRASLSPVPPAIASPVAASGIAKGVGIAVKAKPGSVPISGTVFSSAPAPPPLPGRAMLVAQQETARAALEQQLGRATARAAALHMNCQVLKGQLQAAEAQVRELAAARAAAERTASVDRNAAASARRVAAEADARAAAAGAACAALEQTAAEGAAERAQLVAELESERYARAALAEQVAQLVLTEEKLRAALALALAAAQQRPASHGYGETSVAATLDTAHRCGTAAAVDTRSSRDGSSSRSRAMYATHQRANDDDHDYHDGDAVRPDASNSSVTSAARASAPNGHSLQGQQAELRSAAAGPNPSSLASQRRRLTATAALLEQSLPLAAAPATGSRKTLALRQAGPPPLRGGASGAPSFADAGPGHGRHSSELWQLANAMPPVMAFATARASATSSIRRSANASSSGSGSARDRTRAGHDAVIGVASAGGPALPTGGSAPPVHSRGGDYRSAVVDTTNTIAAHAAGVAASVSPGPHTTREYGTRVAGLSPCSPTRTASSSSVSSAAAVAAGIVRDTLYATPRWSSAAQAAELEEAGSPPASASASDRRSLTRTQDMSRSAASVPAAGQPRISARQAELTNGTVSVDGPPGRSTALASIATATGRASTSQSAIMDAINGGADTSIGPGPGAGSGTHRLGLRATQRSSRSPPIVHLLPAASLRRPPSRMGAQQQYQYQNLGQPAELSERAVHADADGGVEPTADASTLPRSEPHGNGHGHDHDDHASVASEASSVSLTGEVPSMLRFRPGAALASATAAYATTAIAQLQASSGSPTSSAADDTTASSLSRLQLHGSESLPAASIALAPHAGAGPSFSAPRPAFTSESASEFAGAPAYRRLEAQAGAQRAPPPAAPLQSVDSETGRQREAATTTPSPSPSRPRHGGGDGVVTSPLPPFQPFVAVRSPVPAQLQSQLPVPLLSAAAATSIGGLHDHEYHSSYAHGLFDLTETGDNHNVALPQAASGSAAPVSSTRRSSDADSASAASAGSEPASGISSISSLPSSRRSAVSAADVVRWLAAAAGPANTLRAASGMHA